MIKAEIVAHSLSPQGDELISVLATFPRIILAEVNTHRMLSKNTSSSRAIPFNKMVEAIENNPFIPIAWQRSHSGMQGTEYITDLAEIQGKNLMWLAGRDRAIQTAKDLHEADVTKQLANRLLEPFMWTTMLITGPKSGWDNFFYLRCPQYELGIRDKSILFKSKKDYQSYLGLNGFGYQIPDEHWKILNKGQAEIHMMALAESVWDAYNESTPKQLQPGEWHIPFEDKIGRFANIPLDSEVSNLEIESNILINKVKTSVAMAARTSYTIVGEEKGLNYENLISLHDRLLTQDPPHSSPMEHCARAMSEDEYGSFYKGSGYDSPFGKGNGWCYNLKGFIPYRYFVDNGLVI